jgi:hypothetical protein
MRQANTKRLLIIAVLSLAAAGSPADGERGIKVYVDEVAAVSGPIISRAKSIADKMFADAGVHLVWCHGRYATGRTQGSISVRITSDTPSDRAPEALAFALPFEGVHINVFYDRILSVGSSAASGAVAELLAHVFVHEITHLLEGTDRHSPYGVMKATWTSTDYQQIAHGPLPFSPTDLELIQERLASWYARERKGPESDSLCRAIK